MAHKASTGRVVGKEAFLESSPSDLGKEWIVTK